MKILVTGGLGFLGSHICVELLENNDEVVVVDNLFNSKIEVKDKIQEITGKEITQKIAHMEVLVQKIFDRVQQDPDSLEDISKMMEYYLPTTVKLLDAYRNLSAQPVQGENIISSKKEIEKTLDTLNIAFEKLLDSLFQDTAWDVSSDISVLEMMLAQEGLTKDDFKEVH